MMELSTITSGALEKEAERRRAEKEAERERVEKEAERRRAEKEAEQRRAEEEAEQRRAEKETELRRAVKEAERRRAEKEAEQRRAEQGAERRPAKMETEDWIGLGVTALLGAGACVLAKKVYESFTEPEPEKRQRPTPAAIEYTGRHGDFWSSVQPQPEKRQRPTPAAIEYTGRHGDFWSSVQPQPEKRQRPTPAAIEYTGRHGDFWSSVQPQKMLTTKQQTKRSLSSSEIGTNFNKWRKPTCVFGENEGYMEDMVTKELGKFNIDDEEWEQATTTVDTVLRMLLAEIRKEASKYEGLVIQQHIRQGSSREGLKVVMPDEFDILLQFCIRDLDFKAEPICENGKTVPGLCYLLIEDPSSVQNEFPKLHRAGIFPTVDGTMYLSSRNLQEKVFTSIIDTASDTVQKRVEKESENFNFKILRRQNPPSVNITIHIEEGDNVNSIDVLKGVCDKYEYYEGFMGESASLRFPRKKVIDIDLVPGLFICDDTVPDPTCTGGTMKCPKYAVFKWATDNQPIALTSSILPSFIWRMSSSGYEKHTMDVAHGNTEQCYIITALRIAKTYFMKVKKQFIPPQVATVLTSYHLKHIAFYCMLYLTVLNKMNIAGVRTALAYFLDFLEVCLEESCLPHFFQSNPDIKKMFPKYKTPKNILKYNLWMRKSRAILQAKLSFKKDMRVGLQKLYDVSSSNLQADCMIQFRTFVKSGQYYEI